MESLTSGYLGSAVADADSPMQFDRESLFTIDLLWSGESGVVTSAVQSHNLPQGKSLCDTRVILTCGEGKKDHEFMTDN